MLQLQFTNIHVLGTTDFTALLKADTAALWPVIKQVGLQVGQPGLMTVRTPDGKIAVDIVGDRIAINVQGSEVRSERLAEMLCDLFRLEAIKYAGLRAIGLNFGYLKQHLDQQPEEARRNIAALLFSNDFRTLLPAGINDVEINKIGFVVDDTQMNLTVQPVEGSANTILGVNFHYEGERIRVLQGREQREVKEEINKRYAVVQRSMLPLLERF